VIRWALICLVGLLVGACSEAPIRIDSRALGDQESQSPDRFIVLAVQSEATAFVAQAGGTPRGYDAAVDYGPTVRARQTMRAVEKEYGLREVNAWPIQALNLHCAVLEIPPAADRAALLAALSKDKRIKLTQPLQTFATRTAAYNDPYVELQRGFQQMDVAGAHSLSRGDGVKVAIIDTGADILHPDLRASIAAAANFVDTNDAQFRRDRHGTEMAGVIAAVANNGEGIVGVAPNARLYILKACWQAQADADAAHCNSFTLARALSAAFDAHAQVINLSLAGPDDPLLGELIREGQRRGVLFVGAAAEGAVVQDGLLHRTGVIEVASEESRTSVSTVLYAPGREILTLLPGGHYDFASGVSIATAQVSGVVALMLAKDPGLSAAAAYAFLRNTSSSLTVSEGNAVGVDACAALAALMRQGSCRHDNRVALH
jgi:subtilisin family serine protease